MVEKSQMHRTHRPGGIPLLLARYFLRGLQILCCLATIVVWGNDIQWWQDHKARVPADWAFSVAVSSMSLIMALVWMVPAVPEWRFWFVDSLLAVFWLFVFAIWGKIYIPHTCTTSDCQQLKLAAWFSLAAWLLWIVTATIGFFLFNRDRIWSHSGDWIATVRGGFRGPPPPPPSAAGGSIV